LGDDVVRVLNIEDDIVTAKSIAMVLNGIGAVVDQVDSGQEGIALAQRYDYDIVIVDLMLPDIEGYEVVRRLRSARVNTPILILSGLSRPHAKVRGLTVGADDFLTKPFDTNELVARVRAIVRRSKGFSKSNIHVNGLSIDIDDKKVNFNGREIPLTAKEYAMLELLVFRKGMTISKETFLNHLYGGIDEPEIKIIDVFICKIRKKLAAAGVPNLIATAWGRGYVVRDMPGHISADLEGIAAIGARREDPGTRYAPGERLAALA
jgi:two-component system cell cycle response regulator CtrA